MTSFSGPARLAQVMLPGGKLTVLAYNLIKKVNKAEEPIYLSLINCWVISDMSIKLVLYKEKIMLKSQMIKSNHRVLSKHKVDTCGGPVLYLIIAQLFSG